MFDIKAIDITNKKEMAAVSVFLESQRLRLPDGIEYMVAVYYGSRLVGTGGIEGKVLKAIAVDPEFQGEGVSAIIVSRLINRALEMGKNHLFIFTRPESAYLFEKLGYKPVASAPPDVSLLEWGIESIQDFKAGLIRHSLGKPDAACIVVNCNPFSLGHKYLVEKASGENEWLYILVAQEDRSLFPFDVRLKLIKQGTAHLKNITVIPGGDYVISAATFPSYFTRETDLARVHACLDIEVFIAHIAPVLRIKKRYVGEEPYCDVTNLYNTIMKEKLPKAGIELVEVPRLMKGGKAISASLIRERIRSGDIDKIAELVPETTLSYLKSAEAAGVIERIIKSTSRH